MSDETEPTETRAIAVRESRMVHAPLLEKDAR